jgi:hypothetical protein
MSFPDTELHVYRCKRCGTVASTASKHEYGNPLLCNLCFSFMTRLYSEPITSEEGRALAQRGVVYNPGQTIRPKTCDNVGCSKRVGILYAVDLKGVGLFCSAKCADEGVKRHEAAMAQPPASLMGEQP